MEITMKLIANFNKFRNTIVFIHGFRKNAYYWNEDEKGKQLLIERYLSKTANTILIQLEEDDYKKSVSEVSAQLCSALKEFASTKITLIAHSHGAFYGLKLAELDPIIFGRLLLIDPSIKTPEYLEYLKSKAQGQSEYTIEACKVNNFSDLPTGESLTSRIIVRIHLNFTEETASRISYYNKLTNKNVKSRLIVHYKIGHMIHWAISQTIIDSIKELIKC